MALELQQLRQVIALAEHGSFVRAATALHISQPALSRSVQALERRLGSPMFIRTRSGVVPTDLGSLYLQRARDVLRLSDALEAEATGQAMLNSGRVDVGGGPFPSDTFIGPAAARFVEQHPHVGVRLHAGHWVELTRRLRSRELDFFVAEASLLGQEPDLEVVPMPARHALLFVARAGHPLAGGAPIRTSDIFAWPFATPSRLPPRVLEPMLAEQKKSAANGVPLRLWPAVECNGLSTLRRIVLSSNTITASMLSCVATELETGQLVVLGSEPWLYTQYGFVSLRDRPWTQAAEKMRELVLAAERETVRVEADLALRHAPGKIHPPARRPQKPATRSKTQ